jgi:mRNA interferase MazF
MDIPSVIAEFRWNVFLVDLNPVVGSEQANTRPVVVVSNETVNLAMPIVTVLPITSRKQDRKVYPNEALLQKGAGGLERESIVLCHQIRTIDKQ